MRPQPSGDRQRPSGDLDELFPAPHPWWHGDREALLVEHRGASVLPVVEVVGHVDGEHDEIGIVRKEHVPEQDVVDHRGVRGRGDIDDLRSQLRTPGFQRRGHTLRDRLVRLEPAGDEGIPHVEDAKRALRLLPGDLRGADPALLVEPSRHGDGFSVRAGRRVGVRAPRPVDVVQRRGVDPRRGLAGGLHRPGQHLRDQEEGERCEKVHREKRTRTSPSGGLHHRSPPGAIVAMWGDRRHAFTECPRQDSNLGPTA